MTNEMAEINGLSMTDNDGVVYKGSLTSHNAQHCIEREWGDILHRAPLRRSTECKSI